MLHQPLIDQRMALLANPVRPFLIPLDSNASCLIAFGAYQQDFRDIEWSLEFDATRVDCATLGLNLALVLCMDIHSLHHDPMLFGEDFNNLTALALFLHLSADDFNGITFSNLDSHRLLLNRLKALPEPVKQSS
jgi:hypothetical protein